MRERGCTGSRRFGARRWDVAGAGIYAKTSATIVFARRCDAGFGWRDYWYARGNRLCASEVARAHDDLARGGGTLLALGFTPKQVRRLFLREGVTLALVGGIIGTLGGIGYARARLHGLTTIWREAVGRCWRWDLRQNKCDDCFCAKV